MNEYIKKLYKNVNCNLFHHKKLQYTMFYIVTIIDISLETKTILERDKKQLKWERVMY